MIIAAVVEAHTMEAAAKLFITGTYFAVAGASQDTSKFGYKGQSSPSIAVQRVR